MPYSPEDKKRALTRLRRIRGQAEALERAIEAGTECSVLLQQIAALRGAAGGLMAEVLDSHLRETFGAASAKTRVARKDSAGKSTSTGKANSKPAGIDADLDDIMQLLRTYLK
jgi:DNA-binding FrmR family transcriptional regulator